MSRTVRCPIAAKTSGSMGSAWGSASSVPIELGAIADPRSRSRDLRRSRYMWSVAPIVTRSTSWPSTRKQEITTAVGL